MKKLITLIVYITITLSQPLMVKAGNIITFVINDQRTQDEQVIVYPEGTTYEVVDADGNNIKAAMTGENTKAYTAGKYTIVVYPSYRPEQPDRIPVAGKKVQVFESASAAQRYGYAEGWKDNVKKSHHKEGQTISRPFGIEKNYREDVKLRKKIVVASSSRPGQYNLKLYFKNGLEFHYLDGEVTAEMDGEPQVVEGKYIVHTRFGIAKISFNPNNGETWWFFVNKAKE